MTVEMPFVDVDGAVSTIRDYRFLCLGSRKIPCEK